MVGRMLWPGRRRARSASKCPNVAASAASSWLIWPSSSLAAATPAPPSAPVARFNNATRDPSCPSRSACPAHDLPPSSNGGAISGPRSSSNASTLGCPRAHASQSAHRPSGSTSDTSTPSSTNPATVSVCPWAAAACSAVWPVRMSCAFGSRLYSRTRQHRARLSAPAAAEATSSLVRLISHTVPTNCARREEGLGVIGGREVPVLGATDRAGEPRVPPAGHGGRDRPGRELLRGSAHLQLLIIQVVW
eukprot:scaffold10505_cov102-Isochrysis_galbana.AAC.3